jgi:hypothetical protein
LWAAAEEHIDAQSHAWSCSILYRNWHKMTMLSPVTEIGHLTRPSVVRLPVGKIPILPGPKPFANIDIRRRADTTALLSPDAFKQDGHCSETPTSPADAVRGWLGEAPWSVTVPFGVGMKDQRTIVADNAGQPGRADRPLNRRR